MQIDTGFNPKTPAYWIIDVPYYGKFVFYGTEEDAEKKKNEYGNWNRVIAKKHLAQIKDKNDWDMVTREILSVCEDRKNGINGLPYLPNEGWL